MDLLTQAFIVIFILLILTVSVGVLFIKNRKRKTQKEVAHIQTIQESLFDKLTKLKKQLDEGMLTEEEYKQTKNRILGIV